MKVRHVGVTVTDPAKSIEFYREMFGFSIKVEMDESGGHIDNFSGLVGVDVHTIKMSGDDGSLIELLHYRSHPKTKEDRDITFIGCSHFAITVNNLQGLYDKLINNGVEVLCEPQKSPDGKVILTFCKDPDGTLIELVEEL